MTPSKKDDISEAIPLHRSTPGSSLENLAMRRHLGVAAGNVFRTHILIGDWESAWLTKLTQPPMASRPGSATPERSSITHERDNTDRIPVHHIQESRVTPLRPNFIEKPARKISTSGLTEPGVHEDPELRTNLRTTLKNPFSPNRSVTILYQFPNKRRHTFTLDAKHKKYLTADTAPPQGRTPISP
ncbi:hypothetical protein [Streptomyces sp. CS62]|uniref:hypothetical protein n=1 Tax=Streptomyces sp. CS62 TaxID=3119268 RepID=UPI002F928903